MGQSIDAAPGTWYLSKILSLAQVVSDPIHPHTADNEISSTNCSDTCLTVSLVC